MTLVEVVVAISILAVLSTASLGVYLSAMNAASSQQRREVAVTIASQELEGISTIVPSTLYSGRPAAAVEALRLANIDVPGVKKTFAVSSAATPTTVPLTSEVTRSGTKYTISTVIGTCFQPKGGGTCTVTGSYPAQPATPAGSTVLSRVIVVVRWTAGSDCRPTACMYETSTLVDANSDLRWNTHD